MRTQLSNVKRSAPTSDQQADFGGAIERLIEEVADNRAATLRGLPPRFSLEMEDLDSSPVLVLVDSARNRRARIPLEWEDS